MVNGFNSIGWSPPYFVSDVVYLAVWVTDPFKWVIGPSFLVGTFPPC